MVHQSYLPAVVAIVAGRSIKEFIQLIPTLEATGLLLDGAEWAHNGFPIS